jgi:hypothetical protein
METHLAAVHVLDGRLPEREIDVIAVSERADEIRSWSANRQKTKRKKGKKIQMN